MLILKSKKYANKTNHHTNNKHRPLGGVCCFEQRSKNYFMWLEVSFVISNIETSLLPPKIAFSLSSAKIFLLFFGFWRLCFLMYSQSFLTTWDLGIGPLPTTASSSEERFSGFNKAGLAFLTIYKSD